MYKVLKKIMNPTRAPMDSQNPHSPVNKPFDFRIASPTVFASMVVSLFGCNKKKAHTLVELLPYFRVCGYLTMYFIDVRKNY